MASPGQFRSYALKVVFCSALLVMAASCRGRSTLEAGTEAPDFELRTADGSVVKLSDYQGKPVILHFWASWCPSCKQELPSLVEAKERAGAKVHVLSVGVMEDREVFFRFVEQNKLPFVNAVPASGNAVQLYKLTGVPETFVLDAQGRFMLINDVENGNATVRFEGPRQWQAPALLNQITK